MPLLTREQETVVRDLFNGYLDAYPDMDGESLGWEGTDEQHKRFEVLAANLPLFPGATLLDVGCGTGDFYAYLCRRFSADFARGYFGVDLVPKSVEVAAAKHPDVPFRCGAPDALGLGAFDFVIASGVFAVNFEGAKEAYFSSIRDFFRKSRIGFGFNMLRADRPLRDAPEILAFDQDEVLAYCKTLSPHARIVHGYLPIDFSIFLFHATPGDGNPGGRPERPEPSGRGRPLPS